jgi:sugar-specific transcriptional regulator TrmB
MDLGFTLVEAKVYLTLVKNGPLSASAISKISKIGRPDVYRTILKLQQQSLVEKMVKTPAEYRAAPIKETLSFLLQTKAEQYKKIQAETQLFLDEAEMKETEEKKHAEESQIVLIPQGRQIIKKIKDAIEGTQLSVDLVLSWKRFSHGIVHAFAESIEAAWTKNVKFRFIIEKPPKNKTVEQLIQYCKQKPFCQIRFSPRCPETVFGIYDKSEVFIIVFSETDLPGSPALWSNSRSLIALAEDHFEMLWRTANENC